MLEGMRENTDGSEVEGSSRVWMGCLSMVCGMCPPMACSSMCSSRPSFPVPLTLNTAISLPTHAKEQGPGVLGKGSQGKGEML